jgi:hypothetical protein
MQPPATQLSIVPKVKSSTDLNFRVATKIRLTRLSWFLTATHARYKTK